MYSTKVILDECNIRKIDVRSDTLSMPTLEMRKCMSEISLGDDMYGEDPTVNLLEETAAKLFGKEAGLLLPSGTMGNLIAVMVHCDIRGCEAIVGKMSHIFLYEQGNAAQLAGVQLSTIDNKVDGTFDIQELKQRIRINDIHEPITKFVGIENTHNMCGGKVLPMDWIDEVGNICRENNLRLHMDGARIFNAAEYLKLPVSRIVRDCDSVCFCLSKGLCAPIGSVILGSSRFIEQARRIRKLLGGAMRQAGVIAGPGLIALQEIVPILGLDHSKVRRIANAIHNEKSSLFDVDVENVQTNILLIHMITDKVTSSDFQNRLMAISEDEVKNNIVDKDGKGISVLMSARDWKYVRLVVYSQITDEDSDLIIKKICYVIREYQTLLSN